MAYVLQISKLGLSSRYGESSPLNAAKACEGQRAEHMAMSIRALPIAVLGWGLASLSFLVVIYAGPVASTDNQMARMSNANTKGMIGKLVKDRKGYNLGRIQDRVFHWQGDGYTEYAVLSLGGVLSEGDEHLAVPCEALMSTTRKDHFVLNMNTVQLTGVPKVVVYRFYDRSFAAVPGVGRSTIASSAPAMKATLSLSRTLREHDGSAYRMPWTNNMDE